MRPLIAVSIAYTLCCGALLTLEPSAAAQGRGEPPTAGEEGSGVKGRRSEAPAPLADDRPSASSKDDGPSLDRLLGPIASVVESWHRQLTETVGSPEAAWGVLASPAVVLLLLWISIRRRRRPRPPAAKTREGAERGKGGKADGKGGKVGGKGGKERKGTGADAAPLQLPREGIVLLGPDGNAPSLFETLLGLGIESDTLDVLTQSALQRGDPVTWAAAVTDGRPDRLRELRQHWVRAVAMHRVGSWLRQHPLVAEKLVLQEPSELTIDSLEGLALTQADGLGAHLSQEQDQVLRLARSTLAGAFECADNPYRLLHARAGGIKAVLPQSVFAGPVSCYGVALLLGGLGALARLRAAAVDVPELEEFHEAIDEHRQLVDAPVPAEGVAVHALTVLAGGNLAGAGTLMASVAGAAYSTSAVVMRISKLTGELDSLASAAVGRVGALLLSAVEEPESEDGQVLRKNIDQLLGIPLLAEEDKRVVELTRAFERRVGKSPLWKEASSKDPTRPDVALFELHRALLTRARQQADVAKERMFGILGALGNAGRDGSNLSVAQRRIGYTVIALGIALLKGTSTEMLSAAREAVASLNRE